MRITVTPLGKTPADLAALQVRWAALEVEADTRFFRGSSYLFCNAVARFDNAMLVAVQENADGLGKDLAPYDLALGLFNRIPGGATLHETGRPAWDSLFVEHNGFLVRRGCGRVVRPALKAILAHGRVRLSGICPQTLDAARGLGFVQISAARFAPAIDIAQLHGPFVDTISANTRAQIRRSMRGIGNGLAIHRAHSVDQAQSDFAKLVDLHQASWQARGKPGAFADPAIVAFHAELIARAVPRHEVEVLRIASPTREIGYLYNFISNQRVMAYQSGFATAIDQHDKPGLTCHSMAIELHAAEGRHIYDFLAGDSQYKRSLAPSGGETMVWATLYPWHSPAGAVAALKHLVKKALKR